jgi:hypothetical protein
MDRNPKRNRDHPSSNHVVYLVCRTEPAFGPANKCCLAGMFARRPQFDPSASSVVVPLGHGEHVPLDSKEDNVGKPQTFREPSRNPRATS